ncbi:hypothetical protein [Streptomyces sp. NPDC058394]|uniref:hypothetical protein n=1 Tax=Streptomyces sp. NPDC058394 TaxID=3346477 RepID=UPI00366580C6
MNQLTRRRWLWSPITSWQARRLSRVTGLDHEAAWVSLRTATHPEEAAAFRRPFPSPAKAGEGEPVKKAQPSGGFRGIIPAGAGSRLRDLRL